MPAQECRIIAIRPEPGLSQTVENAAGLGLEVAGFPLFEVRPAQWEAPSAQDFDGLLIGSANAIRHGGVQLAQLLDLPVLAVGQVTAELARKAGFVVEVTGKGGLQSVLDDLDDKPRRLLRLSARERIDLIPPQHARIVERTVYESVALPMPAALQDAMKQPAVIVLHSAVAAAHFASECKRVGADMARLRIAAMGARIAAAAGEGWGDVAVSPSVDDGALLALAGKMCKQSAK
ncbi:uroporphyrinogen-III synthase [Altererythrobacter luteolus]|uniref:Uroporphyrinogen-III synthase n=1 Tax=Pontixanthobacter luteolus TaxID=295089 RepID=A0A6I4UW01_9SPHN|nr:uroporphyrinogen-III synthase [Pontixanthobacter luteolus]MXP46059.1 uroporphyrinogen-III synthase [Pontixanthobacter luteolus]